MAEQEPLFTYDDLEKIGRFLKDLTDFYAHLGWKTGKDSPDDVPEFVRLAVGPQLDTLPSYAKEGADTFRPDGLALFMDMAHTSMRSFGRKIGQAYEDVFSEAGIKNVPSCPFAQNTDKIKNTTGGKLLVGEGVEAETTESMSRVAFCTHALSRTFQGREQHEKTFVRDNLGTDINAFLNMLDLCKQINFRANQTEGNTINTERAWFNLPPIQRKLLNENVQNAFKQVYNLILVIFNDDLVCASPDSQKMLIQIRNSIEPKPHLDAYNLCADSPADLGCLILAATRAVFHNKAFYTAYFSQAIALSDKVGKAPDMDSARLILSEPDSQKVLEALHSIHKTKKPMNNHMCEVLLEQAKLANHDTVKVTTKDASAITTP